MEQPIRRFGRLSPTSAGIFGLRGSSGSSLCVSGKFRAESFLPWWTGTAVGCWLPAMLFLPCLLPLQSRHCWMLAVGQQRTSWITRGPVLFHRRQRHPPRCGPGRHFVMAVLPPIAPNNASNNGTLGRGKREKKPVGLVDAYRGV